MSRIQTRLPSIPVRTPKNRFQAKEDEASRTGQRVTLPTLDNMTGTLRFVGAVDGKPGIFAGIEVDEKGKGKNDGSVQGKRYFTCPPKSGLFIAVEKVVIHSPPLPAAAAAITPPTTRRSNLPLTRNGSASSSVRLSASTSTSTRRSHTLRTSAIPKTKSPSSPAPPATSSSTGAASAPSASASAATVTSAATTSTSSTSSLPAINKKSTPTPPPIAQTPKKQTPIPPTPTPPPAAPSPVLSQQQVEQQETNDQLYEMLEKTQRERDQLLVQMKSKETAWERLVSSKESLSLQVQEGESQCQRLARELEQAQLAVEQLQHNLAERDASLAKNQRDEEKQSQDQRRIERLETLVRELQNQLQATKDEQLRLSREHAGTVEQVRKEASASEATTASLEKECEELRRAGLEAIHAYEESVIQLKQKHELDLQQKDQHIQQLDYTIADLKYKQSTLFDDDERDIETRLNEMNRSHTNTIGTETGAATDEADQRHRLEEQLELAMAELDNERLTIVTMGHEVDQLKLELNQARQQTLSVEQKFESLQADFERELADKKRLIEEADNAFEAQAKAEDEHYQMKLSKMALEKENAELAESNKQLEQDFNNLMDEMLALEKQDLKRPLSSMEGGGLASVQATHGSDKELQEKIHQLEKENETHRHSLSAEKNQVNQLSKDLAELESLVESRVFSEADLEERLEAERKKVANLQRELQDLKNQSNHEGHTKNFLISPTNTTTTTSPTPPPANATQSKSKASLDEDYCELCDSYGHDVLQCKSDLSLGKSVTTRSSTSSTTVVKCGYDELYYEDDKGEDLEDISSDDGSSSTYCVIDNARSLPFKKLAEMHNMPESFSGNDQDIMTEFNFLLAQIKQICQQLDSSRAAVQFADTDEAIGCKLKEVIQFICKRYYEATPSGDSGVAFLALLMIGIQVLQTVPEVKEQLLHRTQIGRYVIMNMLILLKAPKNESETPRSLYDEIEFMQILFDCSHLTSPSEMPNMTDVLREVASKFASVDKDWCFRDDYANVVKLATNLFSL
ncbi:hypothetical protein MBANPS3_010296 [Mucor bainieri]